MVALVLLHSPLVGPVTWRPVAAHLAGLGHQVVVPDVTGALAGGPPYQPAIAAVVAASLRHLGHTPIMLVGHSGAGPLLPRIRAAVPGPVVALCYVDSSLPRPGQTWLAHAPRPLVDQLRARVRNGRLPPWHEWFPPGTIRELLPDARLRDEFVRELPRVPFGYFSEPASMDDWTGPAGYLQLSPGYGGQAAAARAAGLAVIQRREHHLAMLTAPAVVASDLNRLRSLILRLP